jgi:conjugative transfer signal peptidase TraF
MSENKTYIVPAAIVGLLLLVFGAFVTFGGIINTGANIPPGLYVKVDKPLAIGKAVIVCPIDRPDFKEALQRGYLTSGNCPNNYDRMMLNVAAKRKDIVSINETGVTVNNVFIPQSKPLEKDAEGRPMPRISLVNYELKDNELLLLSNSAGEVFDGRYFGLIDADQVESVIAPMF